MKWEVNYTIEAKQDLKLLDHTQAIQVIKAIEKVSENPLPQSEGGYGKALGNHLSSKLSGYLKIKLRKMGLRVMYELQRADKGMTIIIISIRDDDSVYKAAQKRLSK